jgi:hypothetical protein
MATCVNGTKAWRATTTNQSIDRLIGLHENIELWYSVDCYVAELTVRDGSDVIARAKGPTVQAALDNLTTITQGLTLEQIRHMRPKHRLNRG